MNRRIFGGARDDRAKRREVCTTTALQADEGCWRVWNTQASQSEISRRGRMKRRTKGRKEGAEAASEKGREGLVRGGRSGGLNGVVSFEGSRGRVGVTREQRKTSNGEETIGTGKPRAWLHSG